MTNIKEYNQSVKVIEVEVQAYSEEHARRVAAVIVGGTMDQVLKCSKVIQGRKATVCKTDDHPVKGTRKWKTIYQVYAYGEKVPMGRSGYEYLNMELVEDDIEQKTEAVKIARKMALKHQLPMTVQIAQKLESHDPTCADIMPNTKKGKYNVAVMVTQ